MVKSGTVKSLEASPGHSGETVAVVVLQGGSGALGCLNLLLKKIKLLNLFDLCVAMEARRQAGAGCGEVWGVKMNE